MHTFTVEIRKSTLHLHKWVVHVRPFPFRAAAEKYKTFDSEQEAIAGAPGVVKEALEAK